MEYSLENKIGQMVMVGFRGTEVNKNSPVIRAIRDYHLGNIWLTDSFQDHGNINSPLQLEKLIKDIKSFAEQPLFIAIDAEGGQVIRLKEEYGFPKTYTAFSVGRKDDLDFTYEESTKIASRLRGLGINLNLVPVVDLNINPLNPSLAKKERCFSNDSSKVYHHARKTIEAHHDQGILCCLKHFPGHGSTTDDSHQGFVDASSTWTPVELEPYTKLLNDSLVDTIIPAHIMIKQFDEKYPATLSKKIIDGLLRNKMQYDGVVISDDFHMGAIVQNYSQMESIELAINAGVDIMLYSNVEQYDENIAIKAIECIKELYKNGRVRQDQIDQSFSRIMALKQKYGQ